MFFRNKDRELLLRIDRKLDKLLRSSNQSTEEVQLMTDIRDQVSALVDKVKSQRTVIEGVRTMLEGLRAELAKAKGQLDEAGEQQASQMLSDLDAALSENTDQLAVATASDTDADDEVHSEQM